MIKPDKPTTHAERERFQKFIKKMGLRLTRERMDLLDGIKKQTGHFSVDELVQRLKERRYRVSRDTVYRNLSLLMEAGVLQTSYKSGRDTLYEVKSGRPHHDHLFCRHCGRVVEFVDKRIEKAQQAIARKKGFKIESHSHQLVGVCQKCQKTNRQFMNR
ncbi:MAG: transcriptional repressor [Candidatus Omnitrophica bacterium]|nr:transcriptional repressor [Candidatus Omnitrophota bacterium]